MCRVFALSYYVFVVFFFKQKTAYEMRISDWSSDVCSSDLFRDAGGAPVHPQREMLIGPFGAANTAGTIPDGRIHGKMLVLEALMDIDALAWQADWRSEGTRLNSSH